MADRHIDAKFQVVRICISQGTKGHRQKTKCGQCFKSYKHFCKNPYISGKLWRCVRTSQVPSGHAVGEDVVVVGYGALGSRCGPSLTSGILSRVITHQSQPVMLQTTCAVQSGASGGAVVRSSTGELLGIVSSNTRDYTAKVTYPHLNFSIPVTILEPLLRRFVQTGDAAVFKVLDSAEDDVRKIWRLQSIQSKL